MRSTIVSFCFLLLISLFCSSAVADVMDVIHLRDGNQVKGRVLEYAEQQLRIELPDGKVITHKMTEVARIKFARLSKASEPSADLLEIDTRIEKKVAEAKTLIKRKPRTAMVVLYLQAEGDDPKLASSDVNYRCYFQAGYSGNRYIQLGKPIMIRESASRPRDARIQLDAGPGYKILNRNLTLEPGKVYNLGRIKFEKKKFEGTASIKGFVRDSFGKPLSGVTVTAGNQEVETDDNGSYQLDGFKLEDVSIKAEAKGYHQEITSRVSIRNMDNRMIKKDLVMFQPRRVKLRYVISAKDNNFLEGLEVEKGSINVLVDSSQTDFSKFHHDSKNFSQFAKDVGLGLAFKGGNLRIANFRGPIFYQQSAGETKFDEVESVGEVDINSQICPALEEGKFVLIRGFSKQPGIRGVSPYCVKILTEKITVEEPKVDK